jgi:hypothetical protein
MLPVFTFTATVAPILAGEIEPVLVHIGDDDVACAGVFHHGNGHDADGAGAGDQNVLAHAFKGQRGVHGVAEGIEDARHLLVHAVAMMPDVRHRHADVFGEGSGAVHADADGVFAKVAASGEAVAAATADDVALGADDLAGMEVVHVGADGDDLADELMPDDHRHRNGLLRPGVPFVDVQVGAADAGFADLDEDIIDADLRLRDILEPESALRFGFDECFHGCGGILDEHPINWQPLFPVLRKRFHYTGQTSTWPITWPKSRSSRLRPGISN